MKDEMERTGKEMLMANKITALRLA